MKTGKYLASIFVLFLSVPAAGFGAAARTGDQLVVKSPLNVEVITQVVFSLVLIVSVILIAGVIYRKSGNYARNNIKNLGVITGFSIGSKERIVLIRAGNEQILIGVAPGVIQKIHVLDKPLDSMPEMTDPGKSFIVRLNRELKKANT